MGADSDSAKPATRAYECTFCRRAIGESELHYHLGEIACEACYRNAIAASEVPMEGCRGCGGAVARQFAVVVEGKHYCRECGEAARVEFNQRQQYRRQTFQNIRFVYGIEADRSAGRGAWAARVIAGLVVAALIAVLVRVTIAGIRDSNKPSRVTFVDAAGNQVELPRDAARERLQKDPEGRVKWEGAMLSREEAERLVR